MLRTKALIWVVSVLTIGLFPSYLSAGTPDTDQLVWIDTGARSPERERLDAHGIIVLRQLAEGLVAIMPADEVPAARRDGLDIRVLMPFETQRAYYLVRWSGDETVAALRARGSMAVLDRQTAVFSPEGPLRPHQALPPRLEWVALSLPSAPLVKTVESDRRAPPYLAAPVYQADIATMVDSVSTTQLYNHVLDLQNYPGRDAMSAYCRQAGRYLADYFQGLGLAVEEDPFQGAGLEDSFNIIATLPGRTQPESVIILSAHYDSINWNGGLAPGADDNASGVAAVMEAARVMGPRPFEYTIRFICFSDEEYGLFGSQHYAVAARDRGDDIVAVINLDMIAYVASAPEDLDLIANPDSAWLLDEYAATTALYTDLPLLALVDANMVYSDHSPFWNQGYSALLGIEDEHPVNPNYHTANDTIDTLDFGFMTRCVRSAVAVTAELAGTMALPPGDLNADGSTDTMDLVLLADWLVENGADLPAGTAAADLDQDGRLSVSDLLRLQVILTSR